MVWEARSYQRDNGARCLSVGNGVLCVEFRETAAWTISDLTYEGVRLVTDRGANGAVVNAGPPPETGDDPWIGTRHGKETVRNCWVIIEGVRHALIDNETDTGLADRITASGKTITLRKESNLGPLDHVMQVSFPNGANRCVEKHDFTVVEDLDKRFNFLYTFMHCFHNDLNGWMALLADGEQLEGRCDKNDATFSLARDFQSIVFYAETTAMGVAYVYPEAYEGEGDFRNSIWDREKDNKLYFRPVVKGRYGVGDTFSFTVTLVPFRAGPDAWQACGREICRSVRQGG